MRKALVLVDIQNDYFPGGRMELVGMDQASINARETLELFRSEGWPVFHVQHLAKGSDATFFIPGTRGVEIHPNVAPGRGEPVVQKHHPNAFRETSLMKMLQDVRAEEVVVCGAMTHMCIDTSIRAASDLGFNCLVVSDACATRDMEHGGVVVPASQVHAAFMGALASAFATVVPRSELRSQLG